MTTTTQDLQPQLNQFTAPAPSEVEISSHFDLAIALILSQWDALTVAVENCWGGPDSSEKRDGLAGSISELFEERPKTDEEDIECVLFQYMGDEFNCVLEDKSEEEVAARICALRRSTLRGEFGDVERLRSQWQASQSRHKPKMHFVQRADDDQEGSADDEDMSDEDEDTPGGVSITGNEVEMEDAPTLVGSQRRASPEIDDDGFTKVVGKKKR
ncbi:MAG: hypothetical protein M1828_003976 [Chrysothrix sp. TS-e1954]|nr:MAG: hypothetical protein M1828_003976 [Chrysothrix sp. TS-e1954]